MDNKPTGTKKIRKGDKVIAISGNSRGLTGVVQSREGDKVIVQGLNVRKKHLKRTQETPKGRIIEIERPIHISNVKVYVEGDTAVKLKVRTDKQGDRQLVYKKGDQEVVYRSVKKPK
jgi:large subunit ribosomal protein L24